MKTKVEETIPLIGKNHNTCGSENNCYTSSHYGGIHTNRNEESHIFSFASKYDYFLIVLGTTAAIIQGAGLPLLSIIFGNMTSVFIYAQNSEWLTGSPSNDSSIKTLSKDEFKESIYKCCLYYLGIGLIMLTTGFFQISSWEAVAERITNKIRKKYFFSILRQQVEWFDAKDKKTGNLSNKLSDDVERLREGLGDKMSLLIQNVAGAFSGIFIGLYFNWQMTLILLILTPLIVATGAFMGKVVASRANVEQTTYGKCNEIAQEVLVAIKTVHAMNGSKRELSRYSNALDDARKEGLKKYLYLGIGVGTSQLMIFASYALSIIYSGYVLTNGANIDKGNIITVMMSVMSGSSALGAAINYYSNVSVAFGASTSILSLLNCIPNIDTYSDEGIKLSKITGNVVLEDVRFRYPNRLDVKVLRGISINIKAGEKIAFVGTSGSGKSTILSLLLRFYDPESGIITIDGHDLRQININSLRSQFGVVSQEPVLFDGTIEENIKLGLNNDSSITRTQIVSACKQANIFSFIETLPDGLNTNIGGRGLQISGGQKQRIAIARAILRNPKILILDEATSALDTESEKIVQDALDKLQENRTTIAVSHRLSTIKNFDKICVLQNGLIVEEGTYEQLIKNKAIFYKMVKDQEIIEKKDSYSQEIANERKTSILKSKSVISQEPSNIFDPVESSSIISIKEYENEVNERHLKPTPIGKILKFSANSWKYFLLGLFGSLISGLTTPLFSLTYAQIFSIFSEPTNKIIDESWMLAGTFIVIGLAFAGGFMISSLSLGRAGENLTKKLRYETFKNLLRQDMSFYDNKQNNSGKICTRLSTDAANVRYVVTRLPSVVSTLITFFVTIGVGLYVGYQLTLILVIMIPLMIGAGYFQMKMHMQQQTKSNTKLEEAGIIFEESIDNIRTVHSFNLQKYFYQKFCYKLEYPFRSHLKQAKVYGSVFAFSQGIMPFFYAVAFYFGSIFIQNSIMKPMDVLRVFFIMTFCGNATGQIASFIPDVVKARLAASLIFHLIDYPTKIDSLSEAGHRPVLKGKIKISQVHFNYPTRKSIKVLDGLSLQCNESQSIALVGHSGSGKSTIIQLLERHYLFRRGTIKIDGYNIEDINIQCLRDQISIVSQEPTLFNCTIEENILYGLEEKYLSHDKVVEAAKVANIHDFISSLPEGYGTYINNSSLSGGQRQRISIARAVIRNPKILLLDEATSALDSQSEKIVQEALDKAKVGRTTISICHRLSTIQSADSILVIKEGKVVETGNHQQLLSKGGLYKKLCDNQKLIE
uniref:ABC-type xenobiotic transporter n=1 Tax=Parastrongyloides trichosuri TaxID=131310 RepID=A0A0N4Z2C0_PARTI